MSKKKVVTKKVEDKALYFEVEVQADPDPPKLTLFDLFQRSVGKK